MNTIENGSALDMARSRVCSSVQQGIQQAYATYKEVLGERLEWDEIKSQDQPKPLGFCSLPHSRCCNSGL